MCEVDASWQCASSFLLRVGVRVCQELRSLKGPAVHGCGGFFSSDSFPFQGCFKCGLSLLVGQELCRVPAGSRRRRTQRSKRLRLSVSFPPSFTEEEKNVSVRQSVVHKREHNVRTMEDLDPLHLSYSFLSSSCRPFLLLTLLSLSCHVTR